MESLNGKKLLALGFILGPILFIVLVNGCEVLQDDLNTLLAWSRLWCLKFNALKCIVLKIREVLNFMYTSNGVELEVVSEQKDLRVLISNNLLSRKHILEITKKAYQRVDLLSFCFTNITQRKISTLFKTTVRPLLEYASVVWQPHLKKDIDMLQKVQNRCLAFCPNPPIIESFEERRK